MNALQALVGSLGILLASFVTLPLVGGAFGVDISPAQGVGMGAVLFVLRFAWLWVVCAWFDRLRPQRLAAFGCDAGPTCWPCEGADFPRTKPS